MTLQCKEHKVALTTSTEHGDAEVATEFEPSLEHHRSTFA